MQLQVVSFARVSSGKNDYFRVEVFSQEGSHGYDLMGLTKEQLICDVLDQYEAHLVFLEAQTELAAPSQINASGVSKPASQILKRHRKRKRMSFPRNENRATQWRYLLSTVRFQSAANWCHPHHQVPGQRYRGSHGLGGCPRGLRTRHPCRSRSLTRASGLGPAGERGDFLLKVADRLVERKDEFALAEAWIPASSLVESEIDMDDITNSFRYFGKLAGDDAGRLVDAGDANILSRITYEPVGVAAMITPWNYPLLQASLENCAGHRRRLLLCAQASRAEPVHRDVLMMEILDELGLPKGVAKPGHRYRCAGRGDPL